jgi:ferric-dicitrate binding protein FerR (iron transport regulator)
MEPERIYDEVITRFLLNEAGPEEEAFVREWIEADEKNRLYVEELRKTLQLVSIRQNNSKINLDQEWIQFRNAISEKQKAASYNEDNDSSAPEWEIGREERRSRRTKIFKLILGSAVAASVILIIGFRSGWFSDKMQVGSRSGQEAQLPTKQPGKFDPLMAVIQHEVNTSGKTKQLILPDGSEIALSDSSELTYKEPTEGNRRDVYLTGNADFKVAKNKAKPFTVFSEDISTTAVGTKFTVTAKEKERFIRVRLHEGKVVIKSLKGYNANWPKEIYLVPGQELVYDKSRREVTVVSFIAENPANKQLLNLPKENPSIPHYDKRSWFMFNNQPLNEIFDALAEMYDRKIVYAKKDIKDMYFIGTYDKSDSLGKILKQIALLNNLTVTKQNDTFKIEKKIVKK